jgi:hypothetical protein
LYSELKDVLVNQSKGFADGIALDKGCWRRSPRIRVAAVLLFNAMVSYLSEIEF